MVEYSRGERMSDDNKIQKRIKRDVNRIREENRGLGINVVIEEIRRYYENSSFSEETLLYRVDKLNTDVLFRESIFSAGVSTFIGLLIGVFTTEKILEGTSGIIILDIVSKSIVIIIVMALLMAALISITKDYSSKHNGYTTYLNEKEIDIIKEGIDKKIDQQKDAIRSQVKKCRNIKKIKIYKSNNRYPKRKNLD